MKIIVTPEGRPHLYLPEKESLKAFLKDKGYKIIHNYIPTSSMMLGADHGIDGVLQDIDECERLAISIDTNHNLGHALALITDNKLEVYDIGIITIEDLDIK
jgi:hypothetical protein